MVICLAVLVTNSRYIVQNGINQIRSFPFSKTIGLHFTVLGTLSSDLEVSERAQGLVSHLSSGFGSG